MPTTYSGDLSNGSKESGVVVPLFRESPMDDDKKRANEWSGARGRRIEIARFTHTYQPIIYASSDDVYGYEIFSAAIDVEGNRVPPDQLLSGIADDLYLCELDQRMMHSASQVRAPDVIQHKRFVNISSEINFIALTPDMFADPAHTVIELTEHFPILNWMALRERTEQLAEHGIEIAIDDFGAGHGNLQMLLELSPTYVKMDKYFAHHLESYQCMRKQMSFLRDMVESIQSFGAKVICEGVETEQCMDAVRELGADFAQGYYIARPKEA
jgi:EAL domain-containing protein (putative c-di-GMP-specific phosphodiesterase class I)